MKTIILKFKTSAGSLTFGYLLLVISYWLFAAPPAQAATSCPSPRGSFSCANSSDWVCGSGGNLFCLPPPAACGANSSYDCNSPSCACACNSGYINCSGSCVLPKTNNCQPGQTFDACSGTCSGYAYAQVGTPAPAAQSGSINITGQYLVNGSPVSGGISGSGSLNYLAKFTGASVLGTGVIYDDGSNIGLRTTTPGFPLDIWSSNGTAIANILDRLGTLWTGWRLERSGEKWFVGMSNSDNSFRIRRNSATDDLVIDNTGLVQVNGLKLASGAAAGYALVSDATGVGSWKPLSCGVGKYDHLTGTNYSGSLNGSAGGYAALTGAASTVCGADSHICTPDEILATTRCAGTLPGSGNAWVANGPPGFTSPASNDCVGFTSAGASSYGTFWEFNAAGGRGFATSCDQSMAIACCR